MKDTILYVMLNIWHGIWCCIWFHAPFLHIVCQCYGTWCCMFDIKYSCCASCKQHHDNFFLTLHQNKQCCMQNLQYSIGQLTRWFRVIQKYQVWKEPLIMSSCTVSLGCHGCTWAFWFTNRVRNKQALKRARPNNYLFLIAVFGLFYPCLMITIYCQVVPDIQKSWSIYK